jgi:hypothetical protein
MAQYLSQLNKFRSWNPLAQQYAMYRADKIGQLIWKKRTYLMQPLESCMLVIR